MDGGKFGHRFSNCSLLASPREVLMAGASIRILLFIIGEVTALILLSNLFHAVLKRLSQPSVVSQLIAGVLAGKTVMGRLVDWEKMGITGFEDHLNSAMVVGRILFMFLIGLEMDLAYLRHTLQRSLIVAYGGVAACMALAGVATPVFYKALAGKGGSKSLFAGALMLLVANTASPVLVRIVTELKLTTSATGRLAITAALANDLTCLMVIAVLITTPLSQNAISFAGMVQAAFETLFLTGLALVAVVFVTRGVNWLNQRQRYVGSYELTVVLMLIGGVAVTTEMTGYNSMMMSFLMGLVIPRQGPMVRTLVDKLTYPVHTVLLPLYFGGMGMRTDFAVLAGRSGGRLIGTAILLVLVSTTGKVAGTLAAANYLKIPFREGLVLGFLLNVKGHVDVITMSMARRQGLWGEEAFIVLLITSFLNTLMAGPASAVIVRQERHAFRFHLQCLERLKLDSELRILTCVHGPHDVRPMLNLVELSNGNKISSGNRGTPLAVYLLHLIELTNKYTITLHYHQHDEDDGDFGNKDIHQVSSCVDAFSRDMAINVRQFTAVSAFHNMHEDVCNGAEDVHASLVLIPFHKERRYDGRMVCRKEGRRLVNQKVLQHAPCTIGILIDRQMISGAGTGISGGGLPPGVMSPLPDTQTQVQHHVVGIFFGGPDDREAVAYVARLAMHPSINATVVRFLPEMGANACCSMGPSTHSSEVAMIIYEDDDAEVGADEEFLSDFHNSSVAPGKVTYIEKFVSNGADVVTALTFMAGMYSLFIVGRGGRQQTTMMMGMTDWGECPELGPVGDMLASEDFMDSGSVLILQQHIISKKREIRDQNDILQ